MNTGRPAGTRATRGWPDESMSPGRTLRPPNWVLPGGIGSSGRGPVGHVSGAAHGSGSRVRPCSSVFICGSVWQET